MLNSKREVNFLNKFKLEPIEAIIPVINYTRIDKAIIYVLNIIFFYISAFPQISRQLTINCVNNLEETGRWLKNYEHNRVKTNKFLKYDH